VTVQDFIFNPSSFYTRQGSKRFRSATHCFSYYESELAELRRGLAWALSAELPSNLTEVTVQPFTSQEVQQRLTDLKGWQVSDGQLTKTFQFDTFVTALSFVNRVGELAERSGHHPDIDIRYNRVRLSLSTHDAGGITGKDFDLAGRADTLA
jgi:4a-hydroxytetrahydrobiopterin dehydratase